MTKKIVIWCGEAANQKALVSKIAAQYSIAGIVIEKKKNPSSKKKLLSLPGKILDRLRFNSIYSAWKDLQQRYNEQYPAWPQGKIHITDSINTKETEAFTREISPDLIIVSGTSLIKEPLLSIPVTIGIINLHTGLSPYVKGGPNCTNWCIVNNDWHLVGNTIMWINAGIDSGNIITSETIDIRMTASLLEAQRKVMEHAHELYISVLHYLLNTPPPYISVGQSTLASGKIFYTKMWTAEKRSILLRNWQKRKMAQLSPSPKTIPLPLFSVINRE